MKIFNKPLFGGRLMLHVIFHFEIYRARVLAREVEEYRLKNFPLVSVKIGRIKAARELSHGEWGLKQCKDWVEITFPENGVGAL